MWQGVINTNKILNKKMLISALLISLFLTVSIRAAVEYNLWMPTTPVVDGQIGQGEYNFYGVGDSSVFLTVKDNQLYIAVNLNDEHDVVAYFLKNEIQAFGFGYEKNYEHHHWVYEPYFVDVDLPGHDTDTLPLPEWCIYAGDEEIAEFSMPLSEVMYFNAPLFGASGIRGIVIDGVDGEYELRLGITADNSGPPHKYPTNFDKYIAGRYATKDLEEFPTEVINQTVIEYVDRIVYVDRIIYATPEPTPEVVDVYVRAEWVSSRLYQEGVIRFYATVKISAPRVTDILRKVYCQYPNGTVALQTIYSTTAMIESTCQGWFICDGAGNYTLWAEAGNTWSSITDRSANVTLTH